MKPTNYKVLCLMLLMTLWAGTAMAQDRIITRPTKKQTTTATPAKPATKPKPQATTGTLSITSSPSGAAIKVDGKYIGETPLTMDKQKPQNYRVTFSAEGYESQTQSVTVMAGKTATCSVTLKKASVQTFKVNGVSFNMILVEGSTFTMGATSEQGADANDNEKPAHQETISSYYIGETEVTQALWEAVMGTTVLRQRKKEIIEYEPINSMGYKYPMYYISWDECQTFISKLNSITGKNFRMPTEEEWEFAARGGNRSQGYKYSGSNDLGNVAWYNDNSEGKIQPVKSKSPNELGIYDMSGSVSEWTQYCWRKNYDAAEDCSSRVIRGGDWKDYFGQCRVSFRTCFPPEDRANSIGLRLAL